MKQRSTKNRITLLMTLLGFLCVAWSGAVSAAICDQYLFGTGEYMSCMQNNAGAQGNLQTGVVVNQLSTLGDHNGAQQVSVLGGQVVKDIGTRNGMTSKGQTAISMEIKADQAEEVADAAADDLANAITYAIIHEYENKTEDQMIAEILEEGRSYGYVDADGNFLSQDDSDESFSFFPKAHASTGHNNVIYGTGDHSYGHASDLTGITGKLFGVSMPMGQIPLKQDQGRGAIFWAKVDFVHGLPGNKSCGSSNRSAQCNSDLFAHIHAIATKGEVLSHRIHKIVYNSRVNCAGCTTTVDNTNYSSFFISAAHADTTGSSTAVDTAANNLGSSQAKAVTAFQGVGYMSGMTTASSWELEHARESKNLDASSKAAASGNITIDDTHKDVTGAHPGKKWSPHTPS